MNPEDKNFKRAFWTLYVIVFILLYSLFLFSCKIPPQLNKNKSEPEIQNCNIVADVANYFVRRCVFTNEVCYVVGSSIFCVKRSHEEDDMMIDQNGHP